ncbi:hypothetical protein EDD35_3184 [Amycolatopsis thermoflava]|uniref:Uncharacterized protein n=1 Tax=Amycolatopsis thermoflava TaxID=84480 RepID=A0A3N2GW15_9PSEU|nr:hypothetical protein EDD35_3184 [Amycolatopsis thermoflava]
MPPPSTAGSRRWAARGAAAGPLTPGRPAPPGAATTASLVPARTALLKHHQWATRADTTEPLARPPPGPSWVHVGSLRGTAAGPTMLARAAASCGRDWPARASTAGPLVRTGANGSPVRPPLVHSCGHRWTTRAAIAGPPLVRARPVATSGRSVASGPLVPTRRTSRPATAGPLVPTRRTSRPATAGPLVGARGVPFVAPPLAQPCWRERPPRTAAADALVPLPLNPSCRRRWATHAAVTGPIVLLPPGHIRATAAGPLVPLPLARSCRRGWHPRGTATGQPCSRG